MRNTKKNSDDATDDTSINEKMTWVRNNFSAAEVSYFAVDRCVASLHIQDLNIVINKNIVHHHPCPQEHTAESEMGLPAVEPAAAFFYCDATHYRQLIIDNTSSLSNEKEL